MRLFNQTLLSLLLFIWSCSEKEIDPTASRLPLDNGQTAVEEKEASQLTAVQLDKHRASFEAFKEKGNAEAALREMGLAIDIAQGLTLTEEIGALFFEKAKMLRGLKQYIGATEAYLQALQAFEDTENHRKVGETLNNIGNVFIETENFDYAITFFEKARKAFDEDDVKANLIINFNLAICFTKKENPDFNQAFDYFDAALSSCQMLTEDSKLAFKNRILNQIGISHYLMGAYGLAIDYYKAAIALDFSSQGVPHDMKAVAYLNIGETYSAWGKHNMATQWLNKSLALSEDFSNTLQIEAYNIFGKVAHAKGDFEAALGHFEKAMDFGDQTVINAGLQETVTLVKQTYRQMRNEGITVDYHLYEKIMDIEDAQARLESRFIEKTDVNVLRSALVKVVELDQQQRQGRTMIFAKKVAMYVAWSLLALLVVSIVLFQIRNYRIKKKGKAFKKEMRDIVVTAKYNLEHFDEYLAKKHLETGR